MTANTIEAVRSAFANDDKLAASFGKGFLEAYARTAFGVLPKAEIDLLVFSLLVEAKVIDPNTSMFRIARALNITPTKARNLLFTYQLRTVSDEDADHAVMIALTTAKYRKEGDNLVFGVHSPLTHAAIRAKMQDDGVFADVSLSGDILRVSPEQFGKVIASLITPGQAKQLMHRLGKAKVVDEPTLRSGVEKVVADVAKDAWTHGKQMAFGSIEDMITKGTGPALTMLVTLLQAG